MWKIATNRDGLLRRLGSHGRNESPKGSYAEPSESIRPVTGEIVLLWESEPYVSDSLPELIVVAEEEFRPFMAWTTTYLDGFRPFTSLCRVVSPETFEQVREAEPLRSFGIISGACAALILADALTQGYGKVDLSSLTLSACESTFSFARSRVIAAGIEANGNVIYARWQLAREIGRQPQRRLSPEIAEPIWAALESFGRGDRDGQSDGLRVSILDVCNEYAREGRLSRSLLEMMTKSLVRFEGIAEAMRESREERVTVLDDALRRSELRHLGGLEGDLVRGYVASLLSPGTLEYLVLVSTYLNEYPMLLMWYAFFAGMHPDSKVLSQFGGLCRRLLKDVEQTEMLFDRPRCDIAVEELEVLSTTGLSGLSYLRGASAGTMRVELFPTITAPVRISAGPVADQRMLFESEPKPPVFNEVARREDNIQSLSAELARAIDLLTSVETKLNLASNVESERSAGGRKKFRRK